MRNQVQRTHGGSEQPVGVRMAPPVSEELRDFWNAFDVHRLQLRIQLRDVLGTERLGLAVLSVVVPDPTQREGVHLAQLQQRAWMEGQWQALEEPVRTRVARLIEDGLVWREWARLLRPIRAALIDRVFAAYGTDPRRGRSALLGLARVLDHLTAFVGEALTKSPAPEAQEGRPPPNDATSNGATAEQTVRLVLDAAPVALLAATSEGVIVAANRQLEALLGYARGELDGRPVETVVPEAHRAKHVRLRARYGAMPSARPMGPDKQIKAVLHDGTELPVEIGLTPFTVHEETLVLASVFEVSESRHTAAHLRRTLDELQRSNEELEQFASVVSHDLQEPLRMVSSYTELLRRQYQGQLDESADLYINYAVEGAQRLSRVVHELLMYSRVGSKAGSFVPTDTSQIVQGVLADLALAIKEANAEVAVEGRLPTIVADSSQLRLVFQNLISNGIKFSREGVPARVRVGSERRDEQWVFWVADNGLGIEPQYLDRIFGLFQRLHSRGEYDGSGIGLTVSRRVIERHGGRIRVESTPGDGSTFYFSLPLWPVTG